mmetsp:Transcript_77475/g.250702  ORF Transcript_77475/g.250702 Transcript_77475/m.250702 type:complete len:437 (+) Transcript_77475:604-1914(+)
MGTASPLGPTTSNFLPRVEPEQRSFASLASPPCDKVPLRRTSRAPSSVGAVTVTVRAPRERAAKRPTRPEPASTSSKALPATSSARPASQRHTAHRAPSARRRSASGCKSQSSRAAEAAPPPSPSSERPRCRQSSSGEGAAGRLESGDAGSRSSDRAGGGDGGEPGRHEGEVEGEEEACGHGPDSGLQGAECASDGRKKPAGGSSCDSTTSSGMLGSSQRRATPRSARSRPCISESRPQPKLSRRPRHASRRRQAPRHAWHAAAARSSAGPAQKARAEATTRLAGASRSHQGALNVSWAKVATLCCSPRLALWQRRSARGEAASSPRMRCCTSDAKSPQHTAAPPPPRPLPAPMPLPPPGAPSVVPLGGRPPEQEPVAGAQPSSTARRVGVVGGVPAPGLPTSWPAPVPAFAAAAAASAQAPRCSGKAAFWCARLQ